MRKIHIVAFLLISLGFSSDGNTSTSFDREELSTSASPDPSLFMTALDVNTPNPKAVSLRGAIETQRISLMVNLPATLRVGVQALTPIRIFSKFGSWGDVYFHWKKVLESPLTWIVSASMDAGSIDINPFYEDFLSSELLIIFNGLGQPESFCGKSEAGFLLVTWNDFGNSDFISLNFGNTSTWEGVTCTADKYSDSLVIQDGGTLPDASLNSPSDSEEKVQYTQAFQAYNEQYDIALKAGQALQNANFSTVHADSEASE
jgi:hypothetical protein